MRELLAQPPSRLPRARCAKEEILAASTSNQAHKRAIERGANDYLLRLVYPTCLCPLKNETTFFTRVTPVEMISELTKASDSLKRVNTVDLLVSLTQQWEKDPRVPEYLNVLMDIQNKAKHAGLPFADDSLADIASSSLLKSNLFPRDRPKWDGKIPEDQTLQEWEDYFLPLHKALERESRLAMGHSDAFSSAHSAALVHNISPPTTAGPQGSHTEVAPASFMEQFDGHFGALSAAATSSTVVMESLAASTTMQYNKIMASMAKLKTLIIAASATTVSGTRESATSRPSPDECTKSNIRINQLMLEVKVKWVPGRF